MAQCLLCLSQKASSSESAPATMLSTCVTAQRFLRFGLEDRYVSKWCLKVAFRRKGLPNTTFVNPSITSLRQRGSPPRESAKHRGHQDSLKSLGQNLLPTPQDRTYNSLIICWAPHANNHWGKGLFWGHMDSVEWNGGMERWRHRQRLKLWLREHAAYTTVWHMRCAWQLHNNSRLND